MSLASGSKLTHYEILGSIGAGGMGEVYRARDRELGREVAIKLLPEDFAQDTERLARLEREARTLASLNHPNIATLYGFERDGATRFLVMELVDGEELAERVARGPLPFEEAALLFEQIASGMEAAHEAGVIHRDLKPANIRITEGGRVKILDFGLAKPMPAPAADSDLSHSPTLTAGPTEMGVLLGTAPYMSPEQAKGKAVDKRTDIWAFGCCLYEALTGHRPFRGGDVPEVLAQILAADPDWRQLPAGLPHSAVVLLQRCLEKDQRDRLRDIGEARYSLGAWKGTGSQATPAASMQGPTLREDAEARVLQPAGTSTRRRDVGSRQSRRIPRLATR